MQCFVSRGVARGEDFVLASVSWVFDRGQVCSSRDRNGLTALILSESRGIVTVFPANWAFFVVLLLEAINCDSCWQSPFTFAFVLDVGGPRVRRLRIRCRAPGVALNDVGGNALVDSRLQSAVIFPHFDEHLAL